MQVLSILTLLRSKNWQPDQRSTSYIHTSPTAMLIKQSYRDVETTANGVKGTMRVIIIEPNVPEYPDAKFPGCVVFSEVSHLDSSKERLLLS
jgi:hypothetical protein